MPATPPLCTLAPDRSFRLLLRFPSRPPEFLNDRIVVTANSDVFLVVGEASYLHAPAKLFQNSRFFSFFDKKPDIRCA
jgi:hypothetical protein